MLYYDGSLWTNVAAVVSTNMNSVVQLNPQEAWSVGNSTTILHWTALSWDQVTPSPQPSGNPNLNSIFTLSNGFGLIVGAPSAAGSQGNILRVPTLSPIPEQSEPQALLTAVLVATLSMISIRRRKLR
jgi:photosystem II stability/assembly factor-like uncharacterized protein